MVKALAHTCLVGELMDQWGDEVEAAVENEQLGTLATRVLRGHQYPSEE